LFVLSQAISHAINQNVPLFEPMGVVAVIALLITCSWHCIHPLCSLIACLNLI
jgi:hypothetical protein